MMAPRKKFKTMDEYVRSFPPDVQKILEQLRTTIKEIVPEAEETISYGIPTFNLNGHHLVHFAAFMHHIGLYPTSSGIEAFKEELSSYTYARGSVQFPLEKPIPFDLVIRIVKYRVKEILEGGKTKR
jgi:uncharacterized protein YdhG (YjbR/CyaY superfamily)